MRALMTRSIRVSSFAMSKDGSMRYIKCLQGGGLSLSAIITDRHPPIQKCSRIPRSHPSLWFIVWQRYVCIDFKILPNTSQDEQQAYRLIYSWEPINAVVHVLYSLINSIQLWYKSCWKLNVFIVVELVVTYTI